MLVKKLTKTSHNEEGLNIIEVVIASIILIIVIVSSSLAVGTSLSTTATTQERNEAAAYAQNILAVAKQAPFRKLALPVSNPEQSEECDTQPETFNNIPLLTTNTPYPELTYCETFTSPNTNIQYVAYTYITQTSLTTFDDTETINTVFDGYVPIRITVKIFWENNKEYITTYVRTPTLSDCIPLNLSTDNTSPAECLEGRN